MCGRSTAECSARLHVRPATATTTRRAAQSELFDLEVFDSSACYMNSRKPHKSFASVGAAAIEHELVVGGADISIAALLLLLLLF